MSLDETIVLQLTALDLIERLAALIPPPRMHRHRPHVVLAPARERHARRRPLFRRVANEAGKAS